MKNWLVHENTAKKKLLKVSGIMQSLRPTFCMLFHSAFFPKKTKMEKPLRCDFFLLYKGICILRIGYIQLEFCKKRTTWTFMARRRKKESSSSKGFFVTIRQTVLYFVLYSLRTWGEISTSGTNTSIIDWGTQYFVEYLFFFLTQIHWSNHCPG